MIFTGNHYIAQVYQMLSRVWIDREDESHRVSSERESWRTEHNNWAIKEMFEEFCSVITLPVCGGAQVRAGEHLRSAPEFAQWSSGILPT